MGKKCRFSRNCFNSLTQQLLVQTFAIEFISVITRRILAVNVEKLMTCSYVMVMRIRKSECLLN